MNFIKKHPLISFFLLTFFISWGLGAPVYLVPGWPEIFSLFLAFGPAIAAIIVLSLVEGKQGLQQVMFSLTQWRVRIIWYFVVLFGPALTMIISIGLYQFFSTGEEMFYLDQLLPMVGKNWLILVGVFIYQLLILWGEEIGWRGYVLPRLENKFHPLVASLILGIFWGLWHLPNFWVDGSVHQKMGFSFFLLATIGYTIIYTWVYNGSKGSLLLICLLHAANNTTVSFTMLFFPPLIKNPLFSLSVLILFDVLIIIFAGPKLLWQPTFPISKVWQVSRD